LNISLFCQKVVHALFSFRGPEEDGFREKLMGLEKNLVEGRKIKIKK